MAESSCGSTTVIGRITGLKAVPTDTKDKVSNTNQQMAPVTEPDSDKLTFYSTARRAFPHKFKTSLKFNFCFCLT